MISDALAAHRARLADSMPESDLLAHVVEMACRFGWRVHHTRPARTSRGYRTPLTGHPGLPDLVLARDGVVMLVELKSQRGRVSPEQNTWLEASHGIVWRPAHWLSGEIERVLL